MISSTKLRLYVLSFLAAASTLISTKASAAWGLNLGYHNPVYSSLGVNFLYWGSQWNFEAGIGWLDGAVDVDDDKDEGRNKDNDNVRASVAGDINLKYRFMAGTFSPYVQGGYGYWTAVQVGDKSGAHASLGGPFVGLGFFLGGPRFYGYVGGNYMIDPQDAQAQGGLGVGF